MAGIALEERGDDLHRAGEVGGDGDLHLVGMDRGDSEQGKQQAEAFHDVLLGVGFKSE